MWMTQSEPRVRDGFLSEKVSPIECTLPRSERRHTANRLFIRAPERGRLIEVHLSKAATNGVLANVRNALPATARLQLSSSKQKTAGKLHVFLGIVFPSAAAL